MRRFRATARAMHRTRVVSPDLDRSGARCAGELGPIGTVYVPVWRCRPKVRLTVYARRPDTVWQPGPQLQRFGGAAGCSVSTSVAADGGTWAAITADDLTIARLTRQSRHWQIVAAPDVPTRFLIIQATDAEHAWLIAPTSPRTAVYSTADGGATWTAIHVPGT